MVMTMLLDPKGEITEAFVFWLGFSTTPPAENDGYYQEGFEKVREHYGKWYYGDKEVKTREELADPVFKIKNQAIAKRNEEVRKRNEEKV